MKSWKALVYFIRRVAPMSWSAMACSLLSTVIKAASPIVTLLLTARLLEALTVHAPTEEIVWCMGRLLAFHGISGILQSFLGNRFKTLMELLKDRFTLYVGQKMMRMRYGDLESPRLQDMRQEALLPILEWGNFEFVFETVIPAVVGGLITILTTAFLLADYKLWLIIPILVTVCIHLALSALQNQRFRQVMMRVGLVERKLNYYDSVTNDFSMGKDIRIFRIDKILMKKIRELNDKEVKDFSRYFYRAASLDVWETLVLQVQVYFVYFVAVLDLFRKAVSVDRFFEVTGLFINFGNAIFQLIGAFVNLGTRSRFLDKFMEFDRIPAEIAGSSACQESPQEVEFSHVSFGYLPGKEILSDISFRVPAGKVVALVGENGSGKTTIAKLLSGFLVPTSGRIFIGKEELRGDGREALSAIYQDFQMFSFTVRENLETAYAGRGSVEETLESVGMLDMVRKQKNGVDTYIYKLFEPEGKEFSYGQSQKLATARALYKNAGIILLDEPTSAFDPKAEYEIFEDFRRLIAGKTAFLISHRLWSCRFCDEIFVVADRGIVERGSHDELMRMENGKYRQMFRAQAQYYDDCAEGLTGMGG